MRLLDVITLLLLSNEQSQMSMKQKWWLQIYKRIKLLLLLWKSIPFSRESISASWFLRICYDPEMRFHLFDLFLGFIR